MRRLARRSDLPGSRRLALPSAQTKEGLHDYAAIRIVDLFPIFFSGERNRRTGK
jgi:hypothetical protein